MSGAAFGTGLQNTLMLCEPRGDIIICILFLVTVRFAIQFNFELARRRKFIGLIVSPWKFDVLKSGIFALEASFRGHLCFFKNIKFPRGKY